jgi:hypothetical protein
MMLTRLQVWNDETGRKASFLALTNQGGSQSTH